GQVETRVDSAGITVRVFPYEPISLALHKGGQQEVRLRLPEGLLRYERALFEAERRGYALVAVYDWWKRREELAGSRFVILRHDVDYDPQTARAMAFIERLLGAHSTFYFRWVTEERSAVEYVKRAGHEVGLHYETLALYCEAHNIRRRGQVTNSVLERCRKLLKMEIARFEDAFGDIHSIASHGAKRNRLLGVPNFELTRGQDLSTFGVELDASLLEGHLQQLGIDVFTADSGNRWRPMPLTAALRKGFAGVYVLMHPCWWRPKQWGPFVVYRP
ncbi:MAG: hypothetical protein GXO73_09470, partial [Calditrichaeota bacterium]|nr:hypothetical protein [Calditrichota bacterium]